MTWAGLGLTLTSWTLAQVLLAGSIAAASEPPRFEPTDCWFTKPDGAIDCGYLVVPENRREAGSRMVHVAVAIISQTMAGREPDPVVFIGGGPGTPVGLTDDGLQQWRDLIMRTPALQQRQVILFEQRGVGRSTPNLNCPEIDRLAIDADLLLADNDTAAAAFRAAALACRERLLRDGADLRGYSGVDFAADLADLRRALGIDSWNLVGTSYGTRIVLTVLRDHPEGVRSAVLNSVYPPEAQAYERYWATAQKMLDRAFAICPDDMPCPDGSPRQVDMLRVQVRRLNDAPVHVDVEHPLDGSRLSFPVTGWMASEFALDLLAFHQVDTLQGYIELLALDHGAAARVAAPYLVRKYADPDGLSDGVYYATECREEYPFNDRRRIDEDLPVAEDVTGLPQLDWMQVFCSVWHTGPAAPAENQPVSSDIPALLLTGELDYLTPPVWAWSAQARLRNSHVFEFRRFGHDVLGGSPCGAAILGEFLEHPERTPSADCARRNARSSPE